MSNNAYLEQTTKLNYLLRIFCIHTRLPTETTSFNMGRQPIVGRVYTLFVYVLSVYALYDLICSNKILEPYTSSLNIDNINYTLITVLCVSIVLYNPYVAYKSSRNRGEYVEQWREYQSEFEKYTGTELTLSSTATITALTLIGLAGTVLEVAANVALTSQKYPSYVYTYLLIYFYTNFSTILWMVDCHLLTKASERLVERFLVMMSNKGNSLAAEVRLMRFTELWQHLSRMTSQITWIGNGLYEFNFFVLSIVIVQSLYGIIVLRTDDQQNSTDYVYIPTAVWSILNLVALCQAAYSVTTQVGVKTIESIHCLACAKFTIETQEQIFTLLKTVQSDVPEITLAGYFILDRACIMNYLGLAVSYIIVLLQFKIGTS